MRYAFFKNKLCFVLSYLLRCIVLCFFTQSVLLADNCFDKFINGPQQYLIRKIKNNLIASDPKPRLKKILTHHITTLSSTDNHFDRLNLFIKYLKSRSVYLNLNYSLTDIISDSDSEHGTSIDLRLEELGLNKDSLVFDFLYPNASSVIKLEGIRSVGDFSEEGILNEIRNIEYGNWGIGGRFYTPISDHIKKLQSSGILEKKKVHDFLKQMKSLLESDPILFAVEDIEDSSIIDRYFDNVLFDMIRDDVSRMGKTIDLDPDLYEQLKSVLRGYFHLLCEGSFFYGCSGVVVSSNTIITASHCLNGSSKLSYLKGNTKIDAQAFYCDDVYDIAVVRFSDGTFSDIRPVKVSLIYPYIRERLIVVGASGKKNYRRMGFIKVDDLYQGAIKNIVDDNSFYLTDGDSGGAVFNRMGELVAISSSTRKFSATFLTTIEGSKKLIDVRRRADYFIILKGSNLFEKAIAQDPKFKIRGINLD